MAAKKGRPRRGAKSTSNRGSKPTPRRKKTARGKKERSPADSLDVRKRQDDFNPGILDRTVIAIPLMEQLDELQKGPTAALKRGGKPPSPTVRVIIDLNLDFRGGKDRARQQVIEFIVNAATTTGMVTSRGGKQMLANVDRLSPGQYVTASLTREAIVQLVKIDIAESITKGRTPSEQWVHRAIYRIWPDFPVRPCLTRSVSTVKGDAARISFEARGKRITWAVVDSGVESTHPHFATHKNLDVTEPVRHESFLEGDSADPYTPALQDHFGHGSHVAGIIAGEIPVRAPNDPRSLPVSTAQRSRDEDNKVQLSIAPLDRISALAPECKVVSYKVLDDEGNGYASAVIKALQRIQEVNQYGRRMLIHGVNLSLGYEFDPEWFACGQSPLCVEVDRLVKTGVVVVVAAGNSGYGYQQTKFKGVKPAGLLMSINDPGNAELAITVGSTHRDMPHLYGASYFSSKGPTGDGRLKPDLLAPGEKILSCAAGAKRAALLAEANPSPEDAARIHYIEDSGTSMAAPHVSGAIAAFLSVRTEFQGRAEEVKALFLQTATDLKRDRYCQGAGLVDLMRAIQAV